VKKREIWTPVILLWANKFLDLLEYIFFFRTICGFFYKKVVSVVTWYTRPRLLLYVIIMRIQLVSGFILFVLLCLFLVLSVAMVARDVISLVPQLLNIPILAYNL
jgi:hypothetical protein